MNIKDGACIVIFLVISLIIIPLTIISEPQNSPVESEYNDIVAIPNMNPLFVSNESYLTIENDSTPILPSNNPPEGMSELEFNVAMCESSMNNSLVGDLDSPYPAYGLFQFQIRTFNSLKNKAGLTNLSIDSAEDQLTLFRWAVANGYGHYWTCYNKLYSNQYGK